jgi:hypothetical protein
VDGPFRRSVFFGAAVNADMRRFLVEWFPNPCVFERQDSVSRVRGMLAQS